MCHTIGMKAIWICLTAAMVALCGCLQKARTPFNEVSIFGDDSANELEKAPTVENYWPLYLSDGRASYWMWPIIKSSPGCFAVQPAYNYDHGIHDILWFITLSPRSGEYRVWPLFYRCPTWWMFAPFAYAADEMDYESAGSPFLFNWNREWYTTKARTGAETRVAPRKEHWNLGLVLWDLEKTYFPPDGAWPSDLLQDKGPWKGPWPSEQGTEWSVLLGALGARDEVSVYHPWEWTARRGHTFGWLLWRWNETFRYDAGPRKLSRSYFTPIYAYNFTQDLKTGKLDNSRHGIALYAISWKFEDERYDGSSLLWGMLFDDDIGRYNVDGVNYGRDTEVLFGLLYNRERDIEDFTRENCADPSKRTHKIVDNVDTRALFGLLYYHERTDERDWQWPVDSAQPETPWRDRFDEELTVLTPLVYWYEGQDRDGSFGSRSLFGLLYDRTYKAENDTETLGYLGYLYRYSRYADGSITRAAFPFINVTTHKDSDDWSFSILGKLFRIERTEDGLDWWLFWL